ncbi:MAG TPA: sulfatase-like hydrolase/transferase [Opitutaceae bacterium]|nr:sulfatase-like hydrolase/transferase [Opitutaceae bacterium]
MKRVLIPRMLFLLSLAFALQPVGAATAQKPNIIVILADDLGAKELGCYGNRENRTPNLDRLAQTGVKFETAFTSPVCHPTRFMLMTGQYGCHNGVLNFAGKRGGPEKHDGHDDIATHVTFGQLLKQAGYATAVAGKWQLSGEQPTLIRETGFDEYCMWGFGNYYTNEDRAKATAAGIDFRSRYWHPSVIRNGAWVPTTKDDYGPDMHQAFALDFIRRKKDAPFFLYYPMCLTHGPHEPSPDTKATAAKSDGSRKSRRLPENFKANVEYMDKLVGGLVAELERLGLRENTLIFFTGDNGTGGDGKSQAVEKGARVPMIVNGPGIVKARGATLELTDLSDVVPTLVEFAGAKLPTDRPIDGHSYAGFLRGTTEHTRDWIFAFQADRRILRTQRWLLEDNSPLHWGQLYDCGELRGGSGYKDVTASNDPEVLAIKAKFNALLATLPAPVLAAEGAPNERKDPAAKAAKRKKKQV